MAARKGKEKDPAKRQVRIEYVGGGPQDGKTYVLLESEIPSSEQPPYREEILGNRSHVYAAKEKYQPGNTRIKLDYVGFFPKDEKDEAEGERND